MRFLRVTQGHSMVNSVFPFEETRAMSYRNLVIGRLAAVVLAGGTAASADDSRSQPVDAEYTAKIREYTTEPFFLTELVDHLPSSDSVPSPKKALGYVVGTPEKLT